jgi:hypothetical protein
LASLGSVIGLPKHEVDGYKDKMDHLLKDDGPRFCEYGIRDAVITLAYWMAIHAIAQEAIAPPGVSYGGCHFCLYLSSYLKKSALSRKAFFGRGHSLIASTLHAVEFTAVVMKVFALAV